METSTEFLENEIDQTRSSIKKKINLVEDKVTHSIEEFKKTFDLKAVTKEHPLSAVGTAFVAGVAIGSLGAYRSTKSSAAPSARNSESAYSGPSLWSRISHQFESEIQTGRKILFAVALDILREKAAEKFPRLNPYLKS